MIPTCRRFRVVARRIVDGAERTPRKPWQLASDRTPRQWLGFVVKVARREDGSAISPKREQRRAVTAVATWRLSSRQWVRLRRALKRAEREAQRGSK